MAKYTYSEAGLTVSDLETLVGGSTGLDIATAAQLTKIDQAITAVGLAVCSWENGPWWWQRGTALFQTATKTLATVANTGAARASNVATYKTTVVHGLEAGQTVKVSGCSDSTFDGVWEAASVPTTTTFTVAQVGDNVAAAGTGTVYVASYPIRSIDIAGAVTSTAANQVAPQTWAVTAVYYDDDWLLAPTTWERIRHDLVTLNSSASKPERYAISGGTPKLWFYPLADAAYNIRMNLVKRHSKIVGGTSGAEDSCLIIPAEFQWDLYVNGAEWLLKHETADPSSLRDCPAFMAGIARMAGDDPTIGDVNGFLDVRAGAWPQDRKVWQLPDGGAIIMNTVTI